MNEQSNSKRILLLKGTAGLGNRLVAYVFAQELARKSGRKLIVDWTDGQFDLPMRNAFVHAFETDDMQYPDAVTINQMLVQYKTYYPSIDFIQKGGVYHYATYIKGYSRWPYSLLTHRARGAYSRWLSAWRLNTTTSALFWAPFSDRFLELGERLPKNLNHDVVVFASFLPPIIPSLIQKNLRLNHYMKERLNKLIDQLDFSKRTLGLHIRFTDKTPSKSLKVLFDFLTNELANYDQLFLSTDSVEVRDQVCARFGNVVHQESTSLSKSNQGVHQYAFQTKEYEGVLTMFEESILDMWALSCCAGLLYQGNSTFSLISHYLRVDQSTSRNWLELC